MTTRRGLLAAPALAAVAAVAAATVRGLYVSPDAVFYVGTARNWLGGRGFTPPPGTPPLEHFPPLWSVVLAASGADPLTVARVVNLACLAGIVLLVGWVVHRRTSSVPAAMVASVLTAAAVDLLTLSASALSEPLFILLGLAGLVVLAAHLERPRPWLLVGAGALVGSALLTRYLGIALVVGGVVALVWRRRLVDTAVFGALSVLPLAAWLALVNSASDRTVVPHMFGGDYLSQAARPFARWFVPWPMAPVGLVLAVLLVAAGVLVARRLPAAPASSPLPWLLVTYSVAYLALLLANRALTDATGRLDARFLAPLHIVAILLVVPRLTTLAGRARIAAGVLVLAQVVGALVWTAGGLTDDSIRRRGYSSAELRASPALGEATSPDVLRPLYTNAVDAVFFVTGRIMAPIPAKRDYLTGRPNPRYTEELAAMRTALENPHGLLLYLDAVTFRRSFQPSRAELEAALPLEVVYADAIGTLYRIR